MRLKTRTVKRTELGEIERHLQVQAKCPQCEVWGDIDDEQLFGTVSMICEECSWHGYITGHSAE